MKALELTWNNLSILLHHSLLERFLLLLRILEITDMSFMRNEAAHEKRIQTRCA